MNTEPNWEYFKDDNWLRAQEITSPRPINSPLRRDKQIFSPQERKEILGRVREVGVLKTAIEFGMDKRVIKNWLRAMDNNAHRNFNPNEQANSTAANSKSELKNEPAAPVTSQVENSPTQTAPATVQPAAQEVTQVPHTRKRAKDFTPEETQKIIARIKEVGGPQAAREFSTTYNVIRHIKAQAALTEQDKAAIAALKKSKDFTLDEKAAIIARAIETTFRKAADEAHISLSTINNWYYKQKIQPKQNSDTSEQNKQYVIDLPEVPEVKPADSMPETPKTAITANSSNTAKKTTQRTQTVKELKPQEQTPAPNDKVNLSMELENALLKGKVEDLTSQINKLKSVIETLLH